MIFEKGRYLSHRHTSFKQSKGIIYFPKNYMISIRFNNNFPFLLIPYTTKNCHKSFVTVDAYGDGFRTVMLNQQTVRS